MSESQKIRNRKNGVRNSPREEIENTCFMSYDIMIDNKRDAIRNGLKEELKKNNNRRLGLLMTVSAAALILLNILLYKTTKTVRRINTKSDSLNIQIKKELAEIHEKFDDIDKHTESISAILDEMIYRAQQDEKIKNSERKLMGLVRSIPRDTLLAKGICIQTENNDVAYTHAIENYEHTLVIQNTRNMFFQEKKILPDEQGIYIENLQIGSFNPNFEQKHYYNKTFVRKGNDSSYIEELDQYYLHAENEEQIEYRIQLLQSK